MSFNYDWQFLRTFFGIQYFRYLVLWFSIVPFAVVILKDVPETVQIPIHNRVLTLHAGLPFNWTYLWVCSIIYVFAWSIYLCRVPRFVQRYNSFTVYGGYTHSKRWIVWEWYYYLKGAKEDASDILIKKEIAKRLHDAIDTTVRRPRKDSRPHGKPNKDIEETWIAFSRNGNTYRLGLGGGTQNAKNLEEELFWELFGATAGSRPLSRYAIWFLLAISAIMFLLTVAQHIGTVFSYLGFTPYVKSYMCYLTGFLPQNFAEWLGCV